MLSGQAKAHVPLPHPLGRVSVLRESLPVATEMLQHTQHLRRAVSGFLFAGEFELALEKFGHLLLAHPLRVRA
jgi:hypothetical protein